MSINYKVHSFNHEIKQEYLSEPMSPLPDVYVSYYNYYNGKVVAVQTSFKIDIPEKITNWEALKQEIREAAEKDSGKYLAPGEGRGNRMGKYNDPVEAHYLESNQVYKK